MYQLYALFKPSQQLFLIVDWFEGLLNLDCQNERTAAIVNFNTLVTAFVVFAEVVPALTDEPSTLNAKIVS